MQLTQIIAEVCPHCGAHVVSESRGGRRSNGQWSENRTFACHMELCWSPNYSRLMTNYPCSKDPAQIAKVQKRIDAKAVIERLLETLDVDDGYKNQLRHYL